MTSNQHQTALRRATLPDGIRGVVGKELDPLTGSTTPVILLWADQPFTACPTCKIPAPEPTDDCPILWGGPTLGSRPLTPPACECGATCTVDHRLVHSPSVGDVNEAGHLLDLARKAKVEAISKAFKDELRDECLYAAQKTQHAANEEYRRHLIEEVSTGSEEKPGTYYAEGAWRAWGRCPATGREVEAWLPPGDTA